MPLPVLLIGLFVGAILGALLAGESRTLFGAMAGAAAVALWSMQLRLSQRLATLEAAARGAVAAPSPARPTTEPPPIPTPPIPEAVPTPAPTSPVRSGAAPARTECPAAGAASRSPPAAPSPAWLDEAVGQLRRLLFEGNVPVKIGLVVSLFGVGALLRYAASEGWLQVPVALRYAGIAAAGLGLLVYGLRQAARRPVFGLSLQGGGIAVLLLTVFAAFRVPGLLPVVPAFLLVVLLVAGAVVLALRQNAVWLAAIGLLGGYLAPVLLSTGGGSHVALFGWYAVLNLAIFGLAWVRPWRALNLMGFAFTFGVGAAWGARHFHPELFASTEPFLVGFFLLYVAIPVLYALRGREPGKVDATLLFGTPLLAFPMQVALLDGERLPLAFSALFVGAVYALIALGARRQPALKVLGQGAAALGLAFATLAVPLALSARWTSSAWALQGVALLWLGQVQQRRWPKVGGVLLQLLAGLAFLASDPWGFAGPEDPASPTLHLALLAIAAGACAFLLDRAHARWQSLGGGLLTALSLGWWLPLGLDLVDRWQARFFLDVDADIHTATTGAAWLGFVALSTALAAMLLRRSPWRKPAWWPALLVPSAVLAVGLAFLDHAPWWRGPEGAFLLALAAALAFALPALRSTPKRLALSHVAGGAALCLALGLGIREGLQSLNPEQLGESWRWVLPWIPLALAGALLALRPAIAAWPVADAAMAYRPVALWLAALLLAALWWITMWQGGSAAPLPWVPLLNPLELFHLAGLVAFGMTLRRREKRGWGAPGQVLLGAAAFLFVSMATLRACWHSLEPTSAFAAWEVWSVAIWPQSQTALSIVWAVGGVLCWVLGSRRGHRGLWTTGAALLGLVLLKLLAVDRQHLGDLMGIVSFLAVGGLLVLVGRLAPRPPRRVPATPESP